MSTTFLGACSDEPTGPGGAPLAAPDPGPPEAPTVRMGEGGGPPGTLSGSFGGGTELTGAGPVTLGELDLDGPALVEVEARGIVPFFWAFGEDEGKQFGALDPAGHSSIFGTCSGNVVVTFSSGGPGGVFAPCDAFNVLPLIEVWTDTLVTEGGTVEARRASGPRGLTLRDCGRFGFACFDMKGSQTVRVSVIADQLQVEAEQTHVAAGTSVNFTASTKDGTRLEIREWIWVPDESVEPPMADLVPEGDLEVEASPGAKPSASMAPEQPVACGSSPVCQFPVLTDGTMYVRGVAGGVIQQAGVGVTVRPVDLRVACGPDQEDPEQGTVTRGETVFCVAFTDGEGPPPEVETWSFEGGGVTVPGPGGVNPWEGTAVTGGTVTVEATIGTEPLTAATTFDVQPRDWEGVLQPYPRAVPEVRIDPDRFKGPAVVEREDGIDVWPNRRLGVYEYAIEWRGHLDVVFSGPNSGFWYIKTPPSWAAPLVILSGVLQPGSRFYEAQTGKRPANKRLPPQYDRWCDQDDMDELRREVLEHEGAIEGRRLSHHQFLRDYVAGNPPGPAVERIVFYIEEEDADLGETMRAQLEAAYLSEFEGADLLAVHDEKNLFTPTCKALSQ